MLLEKKGYIVSKTESGKIKIEDTNGKKKFIHKNFYFNNIGEMAADYLKRNNNIVINDIISFNKFYVLIEK